MSISRELFGPSKKEIWRILSEQINSEFVEGGFLKGSDKVVTRYRDWTITLDTFTVSNGQTSTTYTRMRAPYVNAEGFRFSIYRSGIFSELGVFLGFQDVITGNDSFDEEFVIKASDEEKVKELLSEPHIRDLISMHPRFRLEVKDDEGWFSKSFPDGVDELYFSVPGIIRDIEQLKSLFELFSEVLNRLCVIGAAYEGSPGVEL